MNDARARQYYKCLWQAAIVIDAPATNRTSATARGRALDKRHAYTQCIPASSALRTLSSRSQAAISSVLLLDDDSLALVLRTFCWTAQDGATAATAVYTACAVTCAVNAAGGSVRMTGAP